MRRTLMGGAPRSASALVCATARLASVACTADAADTSSSSSRRSCSSLQGTAAERDSVHDLLAQHGRWHTGRGIMHCRQTPLHASAMNMPKLRCMLWTCALRKLAPSQNCCATLLLPPCENCAQPHLRISSSLRASAAMREASATRAASSRSCVSKSSASCSSASLYAIVSWSRISAPSCKPQTHPQQPEQLLNTAARCTSILLACGCKKATCIHMQSFQ